MTCFRFIGQVAVLSLLLVHTARSQGPETAETLLLTASDAGIASLHAQGFQVTCRFLAGAHGFLISAPISLPQGVVGNPIGDPFSLLRWLDIRHPELRPIMDWHLDLALAKGCDAVRAEKLDGYRQDTGFPLTESDAIDYANYLVYAGQARGLTVELDPPINSGATPVDPPIIRPPVIIPPVIPPVDIPEDDGQPDAGDDDASAPPPVGQPGSGGVPPIGHSEWFQPRPLQSFQWQLSGALNLSYPAEIYDIDLFDTPSSTIAGLQAMGRKVVCYFSAGSYESWRPDAGSFPSESLGSPMDGWPGERWLDIRHPGARAVMLKRLDLAAAKGCDAVEPDNVDGYANDTGLPLRGSDQLAYNRFLAQAAHQRGLGIGLKNDLDQVQALVDDFDFAVNEQCFEYDECELLRPFVAAGKAVFVVEYQSALVRNSERRAALCATAASEQMTLLVMPLELDDRFRLACP